MITSLLQYFAKFVPRPVLQKMFVDSPERSSPLYLELRNTLLSLPSDDVIPSIETFILSNSEEFVSQRVRNTLGFVLFVEYGKISLDNSSVLGTVRHLAVTVAHPYNEKNADNPTQLLAVEQCLHTLTSILATMHRNQEELSFCPNSRLINYPVDINPVDPSAFYGFGGFTAFFTDSKTTIL